MNALSFGENELKRANTNKFKRSYNRHKEFIEESNSIWADNSNDWIEEEDYLEFSKDNIKVYELLCKDEVIGKFVYSNGFVTAFKIYNEILAPEILKNGTNASLEYWLRKRKLDTTRSNARFLLKQLKLSPQDEISAVMFNQALNLTDHYWVREITDTDINPTAYQDVCLYKKSHINSISDVSFNGVITELPKVVNPEITNTGSFDKCWVKLNSDWWLKKKGTEKNYLAELFTYKLGEFLGMCMAEYKVIDGYLCSHDFINESVMLEPYVWLSYMFSNREYSDEVCYENVNSISKKLGRKYLDMILLDAIVCNTDRHDENWGVIKDSDTGEILDLTPNFDNNLAMGIGGVGYSDYLLKSYLNEFGVQEWQKQYVDKLTVNNLKEIYNSSKRELGYTSTELDKDFNLLLDSVNKLLK